MVKYQHNPLQEPFNSLNWTPQITTCWFGVSLPDQPLTFDPCSNVVDESLTGRWWWSYMGHCSSCRGKGKRCHRDGIGGRLEMTETVMRVKREQSSLSPGTSSTLCLCVCVCACSRAAGCCASTDALISQTGPPLWEPHQPSHLDTINLTCTISLNSAGKRKNLSLLFFFSFCMIRSEQAPLKWAAGNISHLFVLFPRENRGLMAISYLCVHCCGLSFYWLQLITLIYYLFAEPKTVTMFFFSFSILLWESKRINAWFRLLQEAFVESYVSGQHCCPHLCLCVVTC